MSTRSNSQVDALGAYCGFGWPFHCTIFSGKCPAVIRDKITVVMADTSYSDVKADKSANIANNRGRAHASVLLTDTSIRVDGTLEDGTKHGFQISADAAQDVVPDCYVGRMNGEGLFVKTTIGDDVVLLAGNEFKVCCAGLCTPIAAGLLSAPKHARVPWRAPRYLLPGGVYLVPSLSPFPFHSSLCPCISQSVTALLPRVHCVPDRMASCKSL